MPAAKPDVHHSLRAADLETGFRSPPHSAGIRCFWWWLNSNVTKEAITRDLEEMKAKGFNGAMIFDADGSSQRGNTRTKSGPVFGSPQWIALLLHACNEAKRLDLELSLNIQSGWNLGGPSVSPAETTQQLVWSKTQITGPATITASPAATRGEGWILPRCCGHRRPSRPRLARTGRHRSPHSKIST